VFVQAPTSYSKGSIELYFGSSNKTSLLTHLEPRAWSLDMPDSVINNRSAAIIEAANNYWSFADFPMAYDPSTGSISNARLHFRVWGSQISIISINAVGGLDQILGNSQPANVPSSGNPFSQGGTFDATSKSIQGTFDSWSKLQQSIKKFAGTVDSTSSSSSVVNFWTNLKSLSNSWLVSNLPGIGVGIGIVDLFISGGRKVNTQRPAPMSFLMNLELSGNLTTDLLISPGVTIPVPGANHTESAIPVDMLYFEPLGVLNFQNTVKLQRRNYWQQTSQYQSSLYRSYRVKEALTPVLNPASGLTLQSVDVALVYSVHPLSEALFLSWADQGLVLIESAVNGKLSFRSAYVPIEDFRFQKINVPPETDITVKVKAVLTRNDATSGTQPVIFIATYEPVFEEGDGVQQAWPDPSLIASLDANLQLAESGVTTAAQTQYGYIGYSSTISVPSTLFNSGKEYRFNKWSDGLTQNPRVLTPSGNTNFTAQYKGIQLSSLSSSYSNSAQRKVVRSQNGWQHIVYESMGNVWYEAKPSSGNWGFIPGMNGSLHLNFGAGKTPAIARTASTHPWGDMTLVAWQEANTIVMRIHYYSTASQTYVRAFPTLYTDIVMPSYYTLDVNPSIAWSDNGGFVLVYHSPTGIQYELYDFELGNTPSLISSGVVPGTDANSKNAAVSSFSYSVVDYT
jgi:hypothetical protein